MTTSTTPEQVPTRTAPLERTTPIRPSEAIRLGCLIAPVQGFDNYFGLDGSACAIGAASLGWGADYLEAQERIEAALGPGNVPCPEPGCTLHQGWPALLNDDHRWSRERIADWLAGMGL